MIKETREKMFVDTSWRLPAGRFGVWLRVARLGFGGGEGLNR